MAGWLSGHGISDDEIWSPRLRRTRARKKCKYCNRPAKYLTQNQSRTITLYCCKKHSKKLHKYAMDIWFKGKKHE